MIRVPAAILSLTSLVCLSACGPAEVESEFLARSIAGCIAKSGQEDAAKCACTSRLADKAFNDREKRFVLFMLDGNSSPAAIMNVVNEIGFTDEEMAAMRKRIAALKPRNDKECKT